MTSPLPKGECSSLIVLTGSLGDVARALPLASALKAARPAGRVSWVVERRWAPIVALSRHVDRVIVLERQRGVRGALDLVRQVRADRYDVVFDLQRILKSGVIARLSRAPRRVGFDPRDAKEGNQFFNNEYVPSLGESVSKLRHYLAFAEHVGAPVTDTVDFGLRADELAAPLPEPLRGRAYVAVVTGASWPSKVWPAARWQRLCELVTGRSPLDVVLVGAAGEPGPWGAGTPESPARVIDVRGRTSLEALGATLAHATAAAGPDTGPGHVSAAVGTPYVGVFGPTDPARAAPWGCEALAVRSAVSCEGCPRRRCRRGSGSCMAAIPAEAVWERLEPLLSRTRSTADSRQPPATIRQPTAGS